MNFLEKIEKNYLDKYSDKKLVLGEGLANLKVMLIGEAPGANEEKQGKAFVGKAGKNLNEFLTIAEINRDDVYITNVVKFRPTKVSSKTGGLINRPPSKSEIEDFTPLLMAEIEEVKPKLVVTLGNVPLKAVLKDNSAAIGDLHGKLIAKDEIKVFPLYHPAAVIYNQSLKEVYFEDLKNIRNLLKD